MIVVLTIFDLVVDHFKMIRGVPDGRFLTLGETFLEFLDDLTIIVPMMVISVVVASWIVRFVYMKIRREN